MLPYVALVLAILEIVLAEVRLSRISYEKLGVEFLSLAWKKLERERKMMIVFRTISLFFAGVALANIF